MGQQISRRDFFKGMGALGLLTTLSSCAKPIELAANGLPGQTVWSTYPTGTGTYNDVAALANMFTSRSGMRVRLMTSDTGISRLGPMINGTAQYARVGDEYYYAFEGNDEYTSEVWGPQSIRLAWTPPGNYGVLVRKDSGIETAADLKGKRFPRLISSTSMNRKLEATLNFGGLTPDDVHLVDIGYTEQAEAMKTGHLDAMYQNIQGGTIEELNTEYPIKWLDLSGGDPEQYETWEALTPMSIVGAFDDGVGMKNGETSANFRYSLPITTMKDRPKSEVREILNLIDRHFEDFKDATPDAPKFAPDNIMLVPLVVPFHEATVEYLIDKGRWTPQMQQRQNALLDREKAMQAQWPTFWAENSEAEDVRTRWVQWKKDNLPALPTVDDINTEPV